MIVVFCPAWCWSLKIWDVVLSHWLLVMMILILWGLILTWVYRASPASMALVVLLVAGGFLERLSLLIVDLAVTVARHYWTLLVRMTEFVRILVILMNLNVFRVLRILFSWSNAFLDYGIVAIYAVRHDWGAHILDAWVAHIASVLVPTACGSSSSRNGLVMLLTNSEFEQVLDLLRGYGWWSALLTNLYDFRLCLVMASWHLMTTFLSGKCAFNTSMVWACGLMRVWSALVLSRTDTWLNMTVDARIAALIDSRVLHASSCISMTRAFVWLIWGITPEKISSFRINLEIVARALRSMSMCILMIDLLLLICNLNKRWYIIDFPKLFLNFVWLHFYD